VSDAEGEGRVPVTEEVGDDVGRAVREPETVAAVVAAGVPVRVGLGVCPPAVPVRIEEVPDIEIEAVLEPLAEILVDGVPDGVLVTTAVLDPAVPVIWGPEAEGIIDPEREPEGVTLASGELDPAVPVT